MKYTNEDNDVCNCCLRECREEGCTNQATAQYVERGFGSYLCNEHGAKLKGRRVELHRLSAMEVSA